MSYTLCDKLTLKAINGVITYKFPHVKPIKRLGSPTLSIADKSLNREKGNLNSRK